MSAQSGFVDPFNQEYNAAQYDAEFNQNFKGLNSGPGKIAQWFGAWDADEYERWKTEQDRAYERASVNSARAWDEYMDSTKYQRAFNDLEAAGVNPYLALSSGVSASGSSNSASTGGSVKSKASQKKDSNLLNNVAMLMIGSAKLIAALA